MSIINGSAYFTGAMVAATWKGGTATWSAGGNNWSGTDMYGNSLPTYAWENKETTATFTASTTTPVTLSGKVITHGITINSGATGYVFNGANNPSLTVTGGGITAHESVTFNSPITIGGPQTWTVDSGKSLTVGGDLHTVISPLTISGNGDTTITGSIDGGGALNSTRRRPGHDHEERQRHLALHRRGDLQRAAERSRARSASSRPAPIAAFSAA